MDLSFGGVLYSWFGLMAAMTFAWFAVEKAFVEGEFKHLISSAFLGIFAALCLPNATCGFFLAIPCIIPFGIICVLGILSGIEGSFMYLVYWFLAWCNASILGALVSFNMVLGLFGAKETDTIDWFAEQPPAIEQPAPPPEEVEGGRIKWK